METLLIIEDREQLAEMLTQALTDAGYHVVSAPDGRQGMERVRAGNIDLVVTDLRLPHGDGLSVLRAVKAYRLSIPVIVMTAYGSIETAVQAVKEGAYDFITKPFEPDHLLIQIERALRQQRLMTENRIFKEGLPLPQLIGTAPAMLHAVEQMRKAAQGKTTVLLCGESGTGKELFAQATHQLSPRREKGFVAINCAAIPRDLLESELFGHERGAFTGAIEKRTGKFELADKGTLFLDEIGDMDPALQAKLLRVLEESDLMRVGGTVNVKIDVRVVAATHHNLHEAVEQKRFREDLYFRLNVFPILIPPLRERVEDIPALTDHFIAYYAHEMKREVKTISEEALEILMAHPWTGNVRELRNSIERAMILSEGSVILPEHLGLHAPQPGTVSDSRTEGGLQQASEAAVRQVESRMIRKVLKETEGNKARAAERLQVSYKTLLTKIKDYGIETSSPHAA